MYTKIKRKVFVKEFFVNEFLLWLAAISGTIAMLSLDIIFGFTIFSGVTTL